MIDILSYFICPLCNKPPITMEDMRWPHCSQTCDDIVRAEETLRLAALGKELGVSSDKVSPELLEITAKSYDCQWHEVENKITEKK